MPDGEVAATVALLRLGRRPPSACAQLLEAAGSARSVLETEVAQHRSQVSLLPEDPVPLLRQAQADVARWSSAGFRIVTVLDPVYPQNLRQVHDRPPLLFVAGRLVPEDGRSIAVIGSRRASTSGLEIAAQMATSFVRAGFSVLSGLARGVDAAAHEATLAADGRTLAVLGTGLARCYPPENADLQRRIAGRCAVVSQFWPDIPPSRETFPMRNRVMSGLSLGTVIIEASVRSGARIQARQALAHGRPVFLLRPVLGEDWARALTARPGVHVVDEPAQIIQTVERLHATETLHE